MKCGRCKKTKDKCNCGRPSKYRKEFIKKVDDYLKENKDKKERVVKYQSEKATGYEDKQTVKLPTLKGFASYIEIDETTLYDWKKKYPQFSQSINKIKAEQHKRLINKGLSGEYNSTIAKLILSSNHGMAEKKETKHDGELNVQVVQYEDSEDNNSS